MEELTRTQVTHHPDAQATTDVPRSPSEDDVPCILVQPSSGLCGASAHCFVCFESDGDLNVVCDCKTMPIHRACLDRLVESSGSNVCKVCRKEYEGTLPPSNMDPPTRPLTINSLALYRHRIAVRFINGSIVLLGIGLIAECGFLTHSLCFLDPSVFFAIAFAFSLMITVMIRKCIMRSRNIVMIH